MRPRPQKPKSLPRIANRLLPAIFYVLLIVFLLLYLRSIDFDKLRSASFSWPHVLVASLLGLSSRYWGAYIWLVILRGLGATKLKRNLHNLVYVYAKAWLGRYIPGTAPWILGKIYFASKHGIPKNKLAVSSLLEASLQVVVTIAVSLILLSFSAQLGVIDDSTKLYMVLALFGCIIFLVPSVFNYLISLAYRLLRKKHLDAEHLVSGKIVAKGGLLYIVGSTLTGLSLFFISKAIYPALGYDTLLFVIAATNLAGAVGMLAIFVPSGIGVRETVLIVLLSMIMPKEFALLISVASRLWSVAVDLLFYLSAVYLRSKKYS